MKQSYDVIVVGAGPAGATLAYELGRKGIEVLLLEKERLPHRKQDLLRSIYQLDAQGIAQECCDFLAHIHPEMQGEFGSVILQH